MQIIADLHTHTIYSTHAFNTMTEMVIQAKKLGLWAIAITDHGTAMPDTGHIWHFKNSNQIPKVIDGVCVLFGAEANLLSEDGSLDFDDELLSELDWVIVSIHRELIPHLTKEQATNAWLKVAENPFVDMIGHCEQVQHEFDIDRVIKAFAENGKIVEMNANSARVRARGQENMKKIALACKKFGCKIAVNSDAHSIYRIGDVQPVLDMLSSIEFPSDLIINSDKNLLFNELKLHRKNVADSIKEQL